MQQADRELLTRAGVDVGDRIILKFLPHETEGQLIIAEGITPGSTPKEVRKTRVRRASRWQRVRVLRIGSNPQTIDKLIQRQPASASGSIMISPERFLAILEEKELLSPRTVASLREQISQSAEPVTAAVLAKRLVKHGRLTVSQAKLMLAADDEQAPATVARNEVETKDLPTIWRSRRSKAKRPTAPIGPTKGPRSRAYKGIPPRIARRPKRPRDRNRRLRNTFSQGDSLLDEEMPMDSSLSDAGTLDGVLSDNGMSAAGMGGGVLGGGRPAPAARWPPARQNARASGVPSPKNPRPARRPKRKNGADR